MASVTRFPPTLLVALAAGVALIGSCTVLPATAGDLQGDRAAGARSGARSGAPSGAEGGLVDGESTQVAQVAQAEQSAEWLVRLAGAADAVTGGDPELALALLDGLPDSAHGGVAPFLRGVAYLRLGDLPAARQQLQTALDLDPDDVPTLSVLARVHYESGDLDRAAELLERAVTLDPDDAPSLASLGLLQLENGELVASFETLQHAVRVDPEQVEAHRGLALLFTAVSDEVRAEQAWRRALDLSPDDTGLLTGLGHVLRDQERPREAAESYRRAAQLQPDVATHAANLGAAWLEAGEEARARRQFERALLMDGVPDADAVLLHFNLGKVLERLGDREGAVDEYTAALELDPELGRAHEALGLIRLDVGDDAGAAAHLEQALVRGGLSPSSLAELALLYDAVGRTEDTLECLALLRLAAEQDPEVPFRLAQVLVRAADPAVHDAAGAIDLLTPLVSDEPAEQARRQDLGAAWNLLAEALAVERRYDEALEAMDRALSQAGPDDPRRRDYAATRERYRVARGDD